MIENTAIQPGINPRIFQQYKAESYSESRQNETVKAVGNSLSVDKVTLSYSTESVTTYDSSMTLQVVHNDGFDLLRGLVINMFKEQGLSLNIPTGNTEPGMEEINLEEITPQEAEQLIADDGYFGVEQTSDRIVDFAIGIAGGDPTRIDAIKAGIDKGFSEAKQAFGDWLPDISYNTYDKVMEKLDDWVNNTTSIQA
ncbi:hypothetical protein [Desulfopila aestuarii]|uniref:DUF5610 domain-containing protein n=1 Tax=Desulfopila aestuarii DSM 18488 TaxID=1121416 RepID=A0A1M7YDP5_9BACT|nr:hypothetical protein [Desulfopila aestuarii]SHO50760.1 hypothetical protein SAMN02745220_03634 [Desulfopila aestuarii DSM 18488]